MFSSAKSTVLRRAPARFSGLHNDDEQKKQEQKEESNSNNSSFSLSTLWDGMKNVRQFNRMAQATGKEHLIPQMPFEEFFKSADAALNSLLGIDEATAKRYDEALQDTIDEIVFNDVPVGEAVKKGVASLTTPQYGATAKPIIYSEWSPVSKLFGMNQETAFSEHMANTAHQREVADLKAAGLNPVLGISGSGSTTVSGSTGASSSAHKVEENGMLDVLGATAAVITAVATKNPMYGYMVSNIFKSFE